jgi:hypothetical protein
MKTTWLAAMSLALFVLTSCTIAGSSRVRDASSHQQLATVPPEALDHQNPGADTSKNPMISRDVTPYRPGPPEMSWRGGSYDALAAIGFALAMSTVR